MIPRAGTIDILHLDRGIDDGCMMGNEILVKQLV
jgi:hypothetical protein